MSYKYISSCNFTGMSTLHLFVKILFCDALSADAFQAKVTQCQQEPGNKNMITHHTPLFKIPGSTSHYLMQYKPFFIILLSGIISVDEDCHLFLHLLFNTNTIKFVSFDLSHDDLDLGVKTACWAALHTSITVRTIQRDSRPSINPIFCVLNRNSMIMFEYLLSSVTILTISTCEWFFRYWQWWSSLLIQNMFTKWREALMEVRENGEVVADFQHLVHVITQGVFT